MALKLTNNLKRLNMKIRIYTVSTILFILVAGAKSFAQVWESPKMATAKFNHSTMAIIPVYITENDKSSDADKKGTKGVPQELETEGYNLQRSFYNYFITRKPKNVNWTVTIQEYEVTNQKLKDAGINYSDILATPKADIAGALGVDAIYFCEIRKTKTISDGAAVALDIFVGTGGIQGNMVIETSIYEGSSGELMWKYTRQFATSYWGRTDYLVDNIMKQTVSKFPYKEKAKKK